MPTEAPPRSPLPETQFPRPPTSSALEAHVCKALLFRSPRDHRPDDHFLPRPLRDAGRPHVGAGDEERPQGLAAEGFSRDGGNPFSGDKILSRFGQPRGYARRHWQAGLLGLNLSIPIAVGTSRCFGGFGCHVSGGSGCLHNDKL